MDNDYCERVSHLFENMFTFKAMNNNFIKPNDFLDKN